MAPRPILNEARHPTTAVDWEPTADKVVKAGDFPFGMQRDSARINAEPGSKEFSGERCIPF
jgi:hypothetical protein